MRAYKGFRKDLTCKGYQYQEGVVNRTSQANCKRNGFHCAENPLDCLWHYNDWKDSVYYMVEAGGDMDEDDYDSKISCTELRLVKKLSLLELLVEGAGYMIRHSERKPSRIVKLESGKAFNGYVVVLGKIQRQGRKGAILILGKITEDRGSNGYRN
ncbi:MAG: hypothetical protein ACLSFZ_00590 [Frisingicoccus sp.]